MTDYTISRVFPSDSRAMAEVDTLLEREGLRRDGNLDYTCGIYDEDSRMIATGSCFGNTLRCFAVREDRQGEGLLNRLLTHLVEVQYQRGNVHLFLYTKESAAAFFKDLGFYEIARVKGSLVFMENRRDGFPGYLRRLEGCRREGRSAAVVMNANPFTLGHQYLLETVAACFDTLHLFLVSEDASLIPADIRRRLLKAGTSHLPNVVLHDSGPYIISAATFPSYFLKDREAVIEGQARLDLTVFCRIAEVLDVTCRCVGEEPASLVTGIYNHVMQEELPKCGIECRVIPRKELDGRPISASVVRQCLQEGNLEALRGMVPQTTMDYFLSREAEPVLERLQNAGSVTHY